MRQRNRGRRPRRLALARTLLGLLDLVLLVLADAVLEKFGGDSVGEVERNLRGYLDNLSVR